MSSSLDLAKEASHFDKVWGQVQPCIVSEKLQIPGLSSLLGMRVLVCSCGSGRDPVRAANAGAEVFGVDLSPVGVEKAREMAAFNRTNVDARVMDLHALEFPDCFFDVLYGSAILHHL